MSQGGLFEPKPPAPDPVAKEIAELRKLQAQRLRAYSDASGELRRELGLALRAAATRLEELYGIRREQERRTAAAAAPPTQPRGPLRVLPGKPRDGRMAAAGEERD